MSLKRVLFLTPASAVTRIFPQLRSAEIEASLAENAKGASAFIESSSPQYIISRPSLPGFKVEELFEEAKNTVSYPRIIVLAEKGTPDEARYFMELGAFDYWTDPLVLEKFLALPDNKTPVQNKQSEVKTPAPKIVGSSLAMRRVLVLAKQVAPSKATVLINGESGTGKEMFSKNLHAWSDRAKGPFIAINCAALPEHLLESELFGHEKGSFTGAIGRKIGKFELASGGTLLLDEISEMELGLQAKLLRALQEGEIDRVGGTETVKVDVRVIATTNRNLEDWVKEGKFRQDLYFRLNVIPLRLPALRERGGDVVELAQFFLEMYTKEYALPQTKFSQEALLWLKKYEWPGNVRELQNLMERAVLLAAGKDIVSAHFLLDADNWPLFEDDEFAEQEQGDFEITEENAEEAVSSAPSSSAVSSEASAGEFSGALMPLHEVERLMIKKGLEVTRGNRTQAAELLGISVRTLRNKLNEYKSMGIEIE